MANALNFSLQPLTQADVDVAVAKMPDKDVLQMLLFHVLSAGNQITLCHEETDEPTQNGLWLRTLSRRVVVDQHLDPDYFAGPPSQPCKP